MNEFDEIKYRQAISDPITKEELLYFHNQLANSRFLNGLEPRIFKLKYQCIIDWSHQSYFITNTIKKWRKCNKCAKTIRNYELVGESLCLVSVTELK